MHLLTVTLRIFKFGDPQIIPKAHDNIAKLAKSIEDNLRVLRQGNTVGTSLLPSANCSQYNCTKPFHIFKAFIKLCLASL